MAVYYVDPEALRALIRKAFLTQPELSKASGVPLNTLNCLITGRHTGAYPVTVERLARTLGCNRDALLQKIVSRDPSTGVLEAVEPNKGYGKTRGRGSKWVEHGDSHD